MKEHDDYDDIDHSATPKGMPTWAIVLLVLAVPCVAIVPCSIIAAIAVPNLIEARKQGNEAAAIGSLRAISTAQTIYRESDADGDGVMNYGDLKALGKADYVDAVLASGRKQGFVFQSQPVQGQEELRWWATAFPRDINTGNRWFYVDQTGVIRFAMEPFTVDPKTGQPDKPLTALGG